MDLCKDFRFAIQSKLLLIGFSTLDNGASKGRKDDLIAHTQRNLVLLRARAYCYNPATIQGLLSVFWNQNARSGFLKDR
jgi:hypothetical protein